MRAFAAQISPQLADDERIVGEYLFARHSIAYGDLPSYFMGFAWIVGDVIRPWDDTIARFQAMGIVPVRVLYRGPYRHGLFETLAGSLDLQRQEGFVVRVAAAFSENDMQRMMGKYVRDSHVQSETHWTKAVIVRNGLA